MLLISSHVSNPSFHRIFPFRPHDFLTFYAMRRIRNAPLQSQQQLQQQNQNHSQICPPLPPPPISSSPCTLTTNQNRGKAALAAIIFSHLLAALSTAPNQLLSNNGCYIALPLLSFTVIATFTFSFLFIKNTYLPTFQSNSAFSSSNYSQFSHED
mmetsp:Transcript_4851/g.6975  ORF Transcript_4851/g.6975 Transcript_4851/m.6975 type:complete len:155 (+) Transcript_4851:782-1246(+)